MSGYCELAIGPMFGGKSSWLIGLYKQYTFYTKDIVAINYSGDVRYGCDSCHNLYTHDQNKIPCIHTERLSSLNLPSNIEIILINEGQFFPDIVEWVREKVDVEHKKIYICGLDGDFKREKFGNLLDLIPFCDKVTKLTALCGNCKDGTKAIFSHRVSDSKEQVLIGEKNHYIPLCRKCYIYFTKSI